MNQVVAYNLMRARRAAGWTQDECAAALTKITGKNWTNASVSAAERSWETGRVREFNANEIMAFAQLFNKSFVTFLLPIPDSSDCRNKYVSRKLSDGDPALDPELREVPQDPGSSWLSAQDMLRYLLPVHEFASPLAEEVNRILRNYGLSYDPYRAKYSYTDPEAERWEEEYGATESELMRSLLYTEARSESGDSSAGKEVRWRFNPDALNDLLEEAVTAALLQFARGVKERSREASEETGNE